MNKRNRNQWSIILAGILVAIAATFAQAGHIEPDSSASSQQQALETQLKEAHQELLAQWNSTELYSQEKQIIFFDENLNVVYSGNAKDQASVELFNVSDLYMDTVYQTYYLIDQENPTDFLAVKK